MSFHVEIEFSGLCFFRIGYPDKKKVTVLLVNTNVPKLTCQPEMEVTPHCPWLKFDTPLKDGPEEIDLSSGYSLRIGDDNGRVSRDYQKLTPGAKPSPPTHLGGVTALHWVPSLQDLLRDEPEKPVLASDCNHDGALGSRVIARIQLNEGNLKSSRIAQLGLEPLEWRFKHSKDANSSGAKSYWRQALTDRVKLSIKNLTSPLRIEMTPASGGPVSVIPVEPEEGRYARLSIRNEPCVSEEPSKHPKVLRHFLWFYELFERCPSAFPIPTTLVVPDNIGEGDFFFNKWLRRKRWLKLLRDVNVFCPPASWDG